MRLRKTIGLSLALLLVSAPAIAETLAADRDHTAPSQKSKHPPTSAVAAKAKESDQRASYEVAERRRQAAPRDPAAALPPPDEYIGPMRTFGQKEIGDAAWYGGRHVGERTASGDRLDAIHATAAHRSLPLYSLVRVTNLTNGRSAIVKINDRGPVSHSLVIDVSPRVADELDMKRAGIARVSIEPVVAVAASAR
jgi:peptidoglycan lytic transglycosylase